MVIVSASYQNKKARDIWGISLVLSYGINDRLAGLKPYDHSNGSEMVWTSGA